MMAESSENLSPGAPHHRWELDVTHGLGVTFTTDANLPWLHSDLSRCWDLHSCVGRRNERIIIHSLNSTGQLLVSGSTIPESLSTSTTSLQTCSPPLLLQSPGSMMYETPTNTGLRAARKLPV